MYPVLLRSQELFSARTDVSKYESRLNLFETALKTYRHIDHIITAVGIADSSNPYDHSLTVETVREVRDISLGVLCLSKEGTR